MKEHDVVVLTKAVSVPAGSIGTIVHDYGRGTFEVEFEVQGKPTVITVTADELALKDPMVSELRKIFGDSRFIENICLSYRHDYGLLSVTERQRVRFEALEWCRAILNNLS